MKLVTQFNDFFKPDAKIAIKDDELWVTIDTRTMVIKLSFMVGGSSKAPSPKS